MKKLAVLTLMVFAPLALMAQTQHLKFKQDGAFASLFESSGPDTSVNLQVARSSDNGGTSATLSYVALSMPDPNTVDIVEIIGAIPASDLAGQTTQHLVLTFDTNDLDPATSVNISCVFDLISFTEVCGPGPSGQIQLDFQENSLQRTQVLALEQVVTFGNTTVRTHQKSDNSTADVQGTILGVPLSSNAATVGVNHSSTLEMIRN
jgi:hypothetical protein